MINSRKTPSKLVLEAPMISPPNDQMTVCRWGFIGAKRHFPKLVGNVDDGVGNGERCWRLSLAGCSSILKLDHNPFISPKGSLSNLAKNDLKRVLTGLHTAMGNFPHGLVQFCFFPSVSYSVLLQCFATILPMQYTWLCLCPFEPTRPDTWSCGYRCAFLPFLRS